MVNAMTWPLYSWERDPVPIVQEAGWDTGPGFINAYNLVQKSAVYDKGQVIVFLLL